MAWTTSDINLATYIEVVKNRKHTGHRYRGRQLLIEFEITNDDGRNYEMEYLSSPYAGYDATKRTFIKLLKLAPG
jgi:hypothetical protein